MSRKTTRKKEKSFSNILVLCFMLVFVCVICFNLYSQARTIYELKQEEIALNTEIEDEKKKNLELNVNQDYYTSDAYIEKVAREQLGLVKPGEIEFINKSK